MDHKELSSSKYRLGVGIMLINSERKVFVGQRADHSSDAWQMPQGGIDDGEIAAEAVMRELQEEVGTDKVEVIYETEQWYSYDVPSEIAKRLWQGQYSGQKQKWFLMKFLGDDKDININTEIPEFQAWEWVDLDVLPDLIVPFKKELYHNLIKEFKPIIESAFNASK